MNKLISRKILPGGRVAYENLREIAANREIGSKLLVQNGLGLKAKRPKTKVSSGLLTAVIYEF